MNSSSSANSANAKRAADAGKAKRKKHLIVVGVLTAGLIIALVTQPDSGNRSSESSLGAEPTLTLKPISQVKREQSATDPLHQFVEVVSLPAMDESQRLEIDLFRNAYVPPPVKEAPKAMDAPPPTKFVVGAIYGSYDSNGGSALVDGKIVRTGEQLDGGAKVLSVSESGIQVTQ